MLANLASLSCHRRACTLVRLLGHTFRTFHTSSAVFVSSMLWSTSVLSTLSSDTEPSVVITFDSAKYLFNIGENTTRSYLQSSQTWRKTRVLFATSVSTQRTSGLPGMILVRFEWIYDRLALVQGLLMTLADAGRGQVHLTGPSGLLHFMATMRRYMYRYDIISFMR